MPRAEPDRRIKRTQRSLHVALNSLILEKGYDEVSIKDITDRANVGRSTFYAHHGSKEGLLLHGLEHLRAALISAQREADAERAPALLGFSRTFFEHVHHYREVYCALIESESGPITMRAIKRIVADAVRFELERKRMVHAVPREALVQFTTDALFSVLAWWFERNPKLPPAEADAIFRRLMLPAL